VNVELCEEAVTFGATVAAALQSAGGDELLYRAEAEPSQRARLVGPVLGELGVWDLDPRSGVEELEAAAAVCRSAGWCAAPDLVAERLCRPRDGSSPGVVMVGATVPRAALAGLEPGWTACTVDGGRRAVTGWRSAGSPRSSAFVVDIDLGEPVPPSAATGDAARAAAREVALGLALGGWTLLGMLERAMAVTREHVSERRQFGRALADFQGVQFQLTDAEVERAGAEEVGKYALWSLESGQPSVVEDALAFRLAALDAADVVFRTAHQLHGAIGFCDETVLSWLSRYSTALRRCPTDVTDTAAALEARVGRRGLPGLFGGMG
jgi:3-oxo-4-pregnene-20-carboxyl-CoA dehydrogenase alpha subunit